jgi:HTH-type transcriptional regulator, sugar sensing transcriptional regulator
MSLAFLQNLDLTKTEIKLYELLLSLGEVPVQNLIKESKLKRPTVYKALYSLEKKRLVTKRDVLKKINFQASPPAKLLELAENKYENLNRTKESLQALLPQLSSSYILSTEKPIVRMFEGVQGLKEIYLDILKDKQPGYSIMQNEDIDEELDDWLINWFTSRRVRAKMPLKMICSANEKNGAEFKKRDLITRRFSKVVPIKLFPFQHEVTIYGNKVAFIHYKKNSHLIGVMINHPFFAQTLKAWFDLAWEGTERYEK